MDLFWAKFIDSEENTYRMDTRIYLNAVNAPGEADVCVGAVIGKNPGSAQASLQSDDLQPISLDGDKLLPTVRNIVLKSYREVGMSPPVNSYVQVLNLFYLCDPNLDSAISSMMVNKSPLTCPSEDQNFHWVWYVWGGESEYLDSLKSRFSNLKSDDHFYYDSRRSELCKRPAQSGDFAKHTQGLKHEYIIPHLSSLIAAHKS